MFAMTPRDKRELDEYRKLGTIEELTARLARPFPRADEGFSPLPPLTRFSKPDFQDGQFSGLLEDDDFECIPGGFDPNTGALIAEDEDYDPMVFKSIQLVDSKPGVLSIEKVEAEDEHYDPDWDGGL